MQKPLTRDHVPPKLLLTKPYPSNLLTVPSCEGCNKSFQKDDEYTRYVCAIDMRSTFNYDVQSKLPAVIRSLQRPNAAGFIRYIQGQTTQSRIVSPLGKRLDMLEVDKAKLNATGTRLVKAFAFLNTGRRLLPEDKIKIAVGTTLKPSDPLMLQFVRMYQLCSTHTHREFGTAFSYGAGLHDDFSIWLMMLYDLFMWVATVTYAKVATQ